MVGVDCSTSASKAIVWDGAGAAVAEGRCPLPLARPRPGWHEQPAEAWWEATSQALRQALRGVDSGRLAGIGLTHQRETFVPVDATGRPLRPGILWMDERAAPLLPALEALWGEGRFHERTGKPLSANLTIAKIAWLREHEPAVYEHAARYLDVAAFLVSRLTGLTRTGWGSADPTGLFDMTRNEWAQPLLESIGLRAEQLPEAVEPGTIAGAVTPAAAAATGLPEGLPVVAGVGDGQSAGLGCGVTGAGRAYLALGTSVILGAAAHGYLTSQACRTMYGGAPGTFLLEMPLLGGGYTVQWFMEHFAGGRSRESLDREAARLPPGSEGLLLVPYWNGVLGPYWDASASGIVVGWRGGHRPVHLYRAILEGIAFEQRLNLEGLEAVLAGRVETLVAVGGGADSDLWLRILADVTGRELRRASTIEAAALGAGILAAAASGLHPDVTAAAAAMVQLAPGAVRPEATHREPYDGLYERVYRQLFPALQAPLGRLAGALPAGGPPA